MRSGIRTAESIPAQSEGPPQERERALELQRLVERNRVLERQLALTAEALRAVQDSARTGNLPALEATVERAIALAAAPADVGQVWDRPFAEIKDRVVASFEREYVESIMARTRGNLAESARIAGMDRANFRRLARRNDVNLDRLRLT